MNTGTDRSSQAPQQDSVAGQSEQRQNSIPPIEKGWREEIEIASDQLVGRVKELIAEGNVRRLIIRGSDEAVIIEVPLTAGVAVGGVLTIWLPVLAALGALAALIGRVKVEIVRETIDPKS